jgi:hypothetical protein
MKAAALFVTREFSETASKLGRKRLMDCRKTGDNLGGA